MPSVAEAILPQVVHHFLHDHPGVWVDIRDMDSAAVLRELESERVDLGLATGVGTDMGIDREALFTDAFGIVCRADHPLASEDAPLHWDALGPWPFIANGLCAQIQEAAFQAIFDGAQLMVHNTTSLLAMVRAGVGVTVLPRLTVDGSEHDLAFVRVTDPAARRAYRHPSPCPCIALTRGQQFRECGAPNRPGRHLHLVSASRSPGSGGAVSESIRFASALAHSGRPAARAISAMAMLS